MDRVCIVDTSLPAYANPTARECVAVVSVVGDVEGLSGVLSVATFALKVDAFVAVALVVILFIRARR